MEGVWGGKTLDVLGEEDANGILPDTRGKHCVNVVAVVELNLKVVCNFT